MSILEKLIKKYLNKRIVKFNVCCLISDHENSHLKNSGLKDQFVKAQLCRSIANELVERIDIKNEYDKNRMATMITATIKYLK